MDGNIIKASSLVAAGFTVGAISGFFFAKRKYQAKYSALANAEITSVKETYRRANKEGVYATPESAVQALIDGVDPDLKVRVDAEEIRALATTIRELGYDNGEKRVPSVTATEYHNAFEDSEEDEEDFRIRKETEYRESTTSPTDPTVPYLISLGEFVENDPEYEQTSIEYYEEDDTLVDEQQAIIPDIEGTVGGENLQKFGENHSEDPNIVYVRNEVLRLDFEIARNEGSYASIVLGIPDDVLETASVKTRGPRKSERDN